MSEEQSLSVKDFGASFKGFLEQVASQAPTEEPAFLRYLRSHFGADPTKLPIINQQFDKSEHPNLQVAMDAYLSETEHSAELLGAIGTHEYMGITLSQLVAPISGGLIGGGQPSPGPVQYINIPLEEDSVLACVQSGLYLIRNGHKRLAVLVRGPSEMGFPQKLSVEVMAAERSEAEAFLAQLRTSMRKRNVYRGHVVSLGENDRRGIEVNFHKLPQISPANIILPEGLLARIERQTVGFSRVSEKLKAAGRHLKRGMLLYGPPGTGKTLTAMYLASQMPERTVILLTGQGVGLIEQSCTLARILQPATLILEDVDLIAEERTRQTKGCNALLFELLNQMDGLADDADILFLLTTNRPEILEPALASRPGRVDQAVEIPLPDFNCRQRLLELYSQGLSVRLKNTERFIQQTEGVSAAFVRELMRKAALFAADEGDEIVIEDRHIEEALHDLVVEGGELTKSLLGVGKAFAVGFKIPQSETTLSSAQ